MPLKQALIVSYSYGGHTHHIAREIQKITGGDWCEIHPWQPYPASFPELLRQVKQEIQSQHYPRLLPVGHTPHLYSILFVGSPNWCGSLAPPLASWLYRNDLSGKVILPFYSHCGGVPCDFRQEICRLCPKADVQDSLGVPESGGAELPELLQHWLAGAGIPAGELVSGR